MSANDESPSVLHINGECSYFPTLQWKEPQRSNPGDIFTFTDLMDEALNSKARVVN